MLVRQFWKSINFSNSNKYLSYTNTQVQNIIISCKYYSIYKNNNNNVLQLSFSSTKKASFIYITGSHFTPLISKRYSGVVGKREAKPAKTTSKKDDGDDREEETPEMRRKRLIELRRKKRAKIKPLTPEEKLKEEKAAWTRHIQLSRPPPPKERAITLLPPNWWSLSVFPVVTSEYRYALGKDNNEKLRKKGRIPAILLGGLAAKILLHIPVGTFDSHVNGIGYDPDIQKFRLLLPNNEVWLVKALPDLHHVSHIPKNMIFVRDILAPHKHVEGDGFEIPKKKYPNYKKMKKDKKKAMKNFVKEVKRRYQITNL